MNLVESIVGLFRRGKKIEKVNIAERFELISRVGQGSMSKVWRARDSASGRIVAVKVLDREKTRRLESRFVGLDRPTEGEVAMELDHPNIVKTIEIGLTTDDEQFLIMEFVDGLGLSYLVDVQNERMQKNRLRYMIELGDAIDYFHRHNFIHRDICPRNVLLSEDDKIKLIDFGLVVPNSPPFQRPGNRTGTANYMAPELIMRQSTDHRIDVFSFAVTCFEMATRRLPWDAAETIDAVLSHVNKPPIDIREIVPRINETIADTIMRGLERDKDRRWARVDQMTSRLREVAQPRPKSRRAPQSRVAKKRRVQAQPPQSEAKPTAKKVVKKAVKRRPKPPESQSE